MKVIDLLNKIAKGEKVPYKIKVRDDEFIVYEVAPITDYQDVNQTNNYLFQDYIFSWGSVIFDDEIEILEEVEDKEYEDINEVGELYSVDGDYCFAISNLRDKINALIRNQKYILEQLKNK